MSQRDNQAGFSAAELLVTLFIGALLTAAAYQLYAIVTRDSEEARTRAIASNIAYLNLRTYSAKATVPCSQQLDPTPIPSIPPNSGLQDGSTIDVDITCPYGTSSTMSKVWVKVSYGTPKKEVEHATFTTSGE